MDNSTQRDEMLMRYLDGMMQGEEKLSFEKMIASDERLREELENLQLARSAVESYGRKQQVLAIHNTMMKELKQTPVRSISPATILLKRIVAFAAIVVFMVLVWQGWLFYSLSALKVFKNNYIEYTPDNMRDGNAATSPAEEAYNDKDYKLVVKLVGSSRNIKDNFIAAHAQLALNNPSAAIVGFKKVIDLSYVAGGSEYKDAAEYNLILSYIRNKDYDLALELMNRLKGNPGHLYHDRMTGKLFRQVKMLKWR
jgi:hypothetical protein